MKQKKIEELTALLLEKSSSANVEPVFVTNDGAEIMLDEKSANVLNAILEQAFLPYLAQVLCEEGYSKEKKGEWVKTCVPDVFQCTNCKRPTKMDMLCDSETLRAYCPNCGAKMTYRFTDQHACVSSHETVTNAHLASHYEAIHALADMVFQFGYSTTFRRQDAVCDGGLSALEFAFGALEDCGCKINSNGTISVKNLLEFQERMRTKQEKMEENND